ncbi:MAG: hypothetical protein ACM3WT_05355, partial [Bacillota bacterium]
SDGRTSVSYSMQVMPSMIRAVITQGAVPFLNSERMLDGVAMALVLVVAYLAYHLIVKSPAKQDGNA